MREYENIDLTKPAFISVFNAHSSESPSQTELQHPDLDSGPFDENYHLSRLVHGGAKRQNGASFGTQGDVQGAENIFLSNMQSNLMKRPTSMPNYHDRAGKAGRPNHGPTFKEGFQSSDGLRETSENTTSVGAYRNPSRQRLSQFSK